MPRVLNLFSEVDRWILETTKHIERTKFVACALKGRKRRVCTIARLSLYQGYKRAKKLHLVFIETRGEGKGKTEGTVAIEEIMKMLVGRPWLPGGTRGIPAGANVVSHGWSLTYLARARPLPCRNTLNDRAMIDDLAFTLREARFNGWQKRDDINHPKEGWSRLSIRAKHKSSILVSSFFLSSSSSHF
jgi:hypothetical protein